MAVALYARVSTTRQAEQDLSIPDQLRQMRDWSASHGHLVAKEYIEPGASATDDRRPVFQEMIADATLEPAPYEAILVHSLSRFFRDVISFGLYERRLTKLGVKVISITQQTADDSSGVLARRVFSAFDEYQSQENSKHTSRAMRENARQGYFNGSGAPFGFRAVDTEALGNRGRRKRRLIVNEGEAAMVRQVYQHYLEGVEGRAAGMKEIAKYLNARGQLMRGRTWGIQKVCKLLSNPTYRGEFFYNVIDSKAGKKRPPSEWISIQVDAIVDAETFERVRQRREGRRPSAMPPRRLSSPVLLTGLLKCGHCGSAMTLVTGKSGRYRYYKCTQRVNKGNARCASRNIAMAPLDEAVLSQLEGRVFTPGRLRAILGEAREALQERSVADRHKLSHLQAELRKADERLGRLYDAVASGALPLDETLQRRVQQAKAGREAVLVNMAGLRRLQLLPLQRIQPRQVETFSKVIRAKLRDRSSPFARSYLHAVVDQIVVNGGSATITGSHARLLQAVTGKMLGEAEVPSFMRDWRAWRDCSRPGTAARPPLRSGPPPRCARQRPSRRGAG